MSLEPARPGYQQLERALRHYEEQPAAAVGLQLLLPQRCGRPAAYCSIPVRQCSHAAGSRNKSAHLMPAGVSPFTPFAALAVSNIASDSNNEEHLEDGRHCWKAEWMILAAAIALPVIMHLFWSDHLKPAFGHILTASWAWLMHYYCNKWQLLGDFAKSQWRKFRVSFILWLRRKASGRIKTEAVKVMEEKLKKLLSPEQLDQLREVLDEHPDADKAYDTDKSSGRRARFLVKNMEAHLSSEQLGQMQQELDKLSDADMA